MSRSISKQTGPHGAIWADDVLKSAITVVDRTSGYVDYTAYVLTQAHYEKNKIF